jgi:DNA-binding CsgD family transcriptional regulator
MKTHHATFYPVGWNHERAALEETLRKLQKNLRMPPDMSAADRSRWLAKQGYSVPGIAAILGIEERTVVRHLKVEPTPEHPAMARDRRWRHVLPLGLVKAQCLNERDRAMLRARDAGATYAQIARIVGIIPLQVRVQIDKARRRLRENRLTPVENYFAEVSDLEELTGEPPVARMRCPTCGRPFQVPVKVPR